VFRPPGRHAAAGAAAGGIGLPPAPARNPDGGHV
jgi:hypothetical protein